MTLQKDRIEHIQAWQAGGLTQTMYCQQQGLNAKTFSRWFKTYQLSGQPIKPLLIPVEMKVAADTLPATVQRSIIGTTNTPFSCLKSIS